MKKLTALLLSMFMSNATADEQWIAQITEAHNFLSERQNVLMEDYKLGEHERFDWDQDTSSLVFSNDGVPAVVAKVQFVGSISTRSNTWLWSWANPSIIDEAKDQMYRVRSFGEKHGYDALTVDKWEGDEVDGWEMTSIAAFVLNAKGAYRTSVDNGFTYMVITDIEWVQN
ncbi:DUF6882 domain-containing protein [Marinobacter gudaonensis]|nr:DUF6882 domain-containing protein [Marinobacter gudaonensis]